MGQKGSVLWFTGLSGSGKSTLANAIDAELHRSAALIPLFYDVSLRAWPKEWIGPPSHPMNDLDLRRVRKVN